MAENKKEPGVLYTTPEAEKWAREKYAETYSYFVYVHTSPDGKKYVGYGHGKPNDRWERGRGYQQQKTFYAAIQKYGWDAFTHEVYCDKLCAYEAQKLERELIIRYESWKPEKGYNTIIPREPIHGPHYSVYQLIFPDGKQYIGRTSLPLEERWKNGLGYIHQRELNEAIEKCGWENVKKIRCIENWCEESAINLEQYLIEVNRTTDPRYGYNKSRGGVTESGWHHTDEAVAKIISAHKGRKNSPETIQRMKEAAAPRAKPVMNTDTGEIYPSQTAAAEALGISVASVSRAASGKRKGIKGINLKYV